jgi:hypothetical protein
VVGSLPVGALPVDGVRAAKPALGARVVDLKRGTDVFGQRRAGALDVASENDIGKPGVQLRRPTAWRSAI